VSSPLVIHATCVALVVANLIVRTWRTQVIFRGLRQSVSFLDIAAANLAGDSAAALTPLRFGGIPAQVAFFQRVGIAPQTSVPTLLVESVLLYPVYAVIGGALAVSAGLEWFEILRTAGDTAGRLLLIMGGLFVVGWLLILIFRRAAPGPSRMVGRSMRESLAMVRGMRPGSALLTAPLTVIDVATRVALMPMLALNVVGAPPADVLAIASFALLYGQIAMPTPGGAGIVDAGILGGAAGDLGADASSIVLWWRVYTAGIHILACAPMLWWRLSDRVRRRRPVRITSHDLTAADPATTDAASTVSP
jgi:uncharacterized membrane protein YbhN (UPF0104 family)